MSSRLLSSYKDDTLRFMATYDKFMNAGDHQPRAACQQGQSSFLTKLPPEMRILVYEEVFKAYRWGLKSDINISDVLLSPPKALLVTPDLFLVCRIVHKEALRVLRHLEPPTLFAVFRITYPRQLKENKSFEKNSTRLRRVISQLHVVNLMIFIPTQFWYLDQVVTMLQWIAAIVKDAQVMRACNITLYTSRSREALCAADFTIGKIGPLLLKVLETAMTIHRSQSVEPWPLEAVVKELEGSQDDPRLPQAMSESAALGRLRYLYSGGE